MTEVGDHLAATYGIGVEATTEMGEPVPIVDSGSVSVWYRLTTPIGQRVQRLRAIDPEWREKLRAA